jgi:hypothetical protein
MKKAEVPQENNVVFEGGFKALYAVNEDGKYVVTPSSGWKVEETVTLMAVEDFRRQAEEARQRVLAGKSSALEYHMYAQRMDLPTLAQSVGMFQWRVKRHLRPAVFATLGEDMLERYADALGVPAAGLRQVPG